MKPRVNETEGLYWFHLVRPSVYVCTRLYTDVYPLCKLSSDWQVKICSTWREDGTCSISLTIPNSNFWRFFLINNLDMVLSPCMWLECHCCCPSFYCNPFIFDKMILLVGHWIKVMCFAKIANSNYCKFSKFWLIVWDWLSARYLALMIPPPFQRKKGSMELSLSLCPCDFIICQPTLISSHNTHIM